MVQTKDEYRAYQREWQRQFRKKNKEQIAIKDKERYQKHRKERLARQKVHRNEVKDTLLPKKRAHYYKNKDKILAKNKERYEKNKRRVLAINSKYLKTEKGRLIKFKILANRGRKLGYNTLNDWFAGCHGHHINYTYVIFIPEWIHKLYWHSLRRKKTMRKINQMAIDYLFATEC